MSGLPPSEEQEEFRRPVRGFLDRHWPMAAVRRARVGNGVRPRSAVCEAAHAIDEESEDVPMLAAMVSSLASETAVAVTAENIQIHGGVGYTWEHDAHLFYKRAIASEVLFGAGTLQRQKVADLLAI